jgi:hypothetical protein
MLFSQLLPALLLPALLLPALLLPSYCWAAPGSLHSTLRESFTKHATTYSQFHYYNSCSPCCATACSGCATAAQMSTLGPALLHSVFQHSVDCSADTAAERSSCSTALLQAGEALTHVDAVVALQALRLLQLRQQRCLLLVS